jgi:hypothetical protein
MVKPQELILKGHNNTNEEMSYIYYDVSNMKMHWYVEILVQLIIYFLFVKLDH